MYSDEEYDTDETVGYEETSESMELRQPSSQRRPQRHRKLPDDITATSVVQSHRKVTNGRFNQ